MIRPEAAAALTRWSEAIVSVAVTAFGIWLIVLGGWLLWALGAVVVLTGLGLLRGALQRLRLVPAGDGPGLVEIDEGQVAWYGPGVGGFVSLAELADIGLVRVQGVRSWRLRQRDGQLLLVPVDASGVEGLHQALGVLPGLDLRQLSDALARDHDTPFVWRDAPAKVVRLGR